MSRITKYLRQLCSYEPALRDSKGNVLHDKFGEPLYSDPTIIKCRREETIQDVQTSTGAILKSSTRYLLDGMHKIQADDLLDGKPVLKVQEYINQFGAAEGYEAYV